MSLVNLGKQLLEAAKQGLTDDVRALMSSGAPFTTDWLGTSPLHFAAQYGRLDTSEVLLRAGISRDARTKVDRTPLHVAAQEGHRTIVELLLANAADIEARDMLRMTPLHWAVQKGHADVVELLLSHGAGINSQNKFEKTPIDIAVDIGREDIVDLLNMSRTVVELNADNTVVEEVETTETSAAVGGIVMNIGGQNRTNDTQSTHVPRIVGLVKYERVSNEEPVETNNTEVLATLAALADARSPTVDSATTVTAADALSWLETHGITTPSDESSIFSSTLASGQTFVLTEAGKLALNSVQQQTTDTARNQSKVITIRRSDAILPSSSITISTDDQTKLLMEDDDEHEAKRFRSDDTAAGDDGVDQQELRRQLKEVQRQAAEYKQQLKRKELEAETYKKQLTKITISKRT